MYADRAAFDLAFGASEAMDLDAATGRIDSAIASACAVADGYIAARYSTPVSSVGSALKSAVLDIARYSLWDNQAPDEVRTRFEDALRWLRDVSSGKAVLTDSTGAVMTTPTTSSGMAAASVRTMSYGASFDARYQPDLVVRPSWPL